MIRLFVSIGTSAWPGAETIAIRCAAPPTWMPNWMFRAASGLARIARWRRIDRIELGNISHELRNGARPRPRPSKLLPSPRFSGCGPASLLRRLIPSDALDLEEILKTVLGIFAAIAGLLVAAE